MTSTHASSELPKHGLMTKIAHAGLAISVIFQLLSSLIISTPEAGQTGGRLFFAHEYIGLMSFAAALGFWIVLAFRRRGIPLKQLFPWFTADERAAVIRDCTRAFSQARALRVPDIDKVEALTSAIHGLGLALGTFMAATGVFWYVATLTGYANSVIATILFNLHGAFGNLVWAYLIGHVGMAILHQYLGRPIITEMWSVSTPQTDAENLGLPEAEQPE